jgi:hypothetical protein
MIPNFPNCPINPKLSSKNPLNKEPPTHPKIPDNHQNKTISSLKFPTKNYRNGLILTLYIKKDPKKTKSGKKIKNSLFRTKSIFN